MRLTWQPSLLGVQEPAVDPTFAGAVRVLLDDAGGAWVDHVAGWVVGADALMAELVEIISWQSPIVHMYDQAVQQPRLNGRLPEAKRPPAVEAMRGALSRRYGVELTSVGANLYRDGRDSVVWHGDRIARDLPEALVGIVSLGGDRRFLLRPKGGGPSRRIELRSGDLLVMGGSCQRTWDHCVPKVARAAPRMSLTFRHAEDG